MANYDESEYFTDSQEEIAEREAQEALRRMVRTEIRRVQTGAADADIADDIAREEEQAVEKAKREKPRWMVKAERFFTGDILLAEEADKVYHLLVLLGLVFLVSIFTIFGAFQQDLRRNTLQKEVALLKERAIRMSEERMQHSSHSAILKKLQDRGIEIEDPKNPPMVVK
jgi:hypothetical protein